MKGKKMVTEVNLNLLKTQLSGTNTNNSGTKISCETLFDNAGAGQDPSVGSLNFISKNNDSSSPAVAAVEAEINVIDLQIEQLNKAIEEKEAELYKTNKELETEQTKNQSLQDQEAADQQQKMEQAQKTALEKFKAQEGNDKKEYEFFFSEEMAKITSTYSSEISASSDRLNTLEGKIVSIQDSADSLALQRNTFYEKKSALSTKISTIEASTLAEKSQPKLEQYA